jgi:Ran GTPase-activating protein (RanGAP) involved in mRNA processing and transport
VTLERLRHLLHEEPSQETWDAALDLVRAARGPDRAVYVSYLIQHAEGWPAGMRRLTSEDVPASLDPLPDLWSICGSLSLQNAGLKPPDVIRLAQSGRLTNLESLDLSHNHVGPDGAIALAACRDLGGLTYLNLGRSRIGDEGARALGDSEQLRSVKHLCVGRASLRSGGVQDLLTSAMLSRVETLEMDHAAVGVRGGQALAANPDAGQLRSINFHACNLSDNGAAALASSPHLRLERARLSQNGLGLVAVEALADGTLLTHLRHLDLTGNGPLMGRGLAALAQARSNQLQSLVLHGAGIELSNLRALVHASSAQHLRALDPGLEFKRRHEVAPILLETSHLVHLEELHLRGLKLSAALLLAGSRSLPALRRLYVEVIDVDADGAMQFPYAPQVDKLSKLRLDAAGNAAGLEAVVTGPGMARVRHLELRGEAVTDGLVERLASNVAGAALRTLSVCEPALGDRAAVAIARSPHLRNLEYLDLRSAAVTNEGATALAAADWPHLRRLGLRFTAVGNAGVTALAGAGGMPVVTEVNLDCASATSAGFAEALDAATRRQALAMLRPLTATNSAGAAGVGGLREIAQARGLAGSGRLRRADLIDVLAGK